MDKKTRFTTAAGNFGKILVVRLTEGDDLIKSLEEIAVQHNITSGVILSGVASLSKTVLRNLGLFPDEFPITNRERVFEKREEPLELLSVSGNISLKDGKPLVHGHIVISTAPHGAAYGGHLVEGTIIYSTAEILIAEYADVKVIRREDEHTRGYELYPMEEQSGE